MIRASEESQRVVPADLGLPDKFAEFRRGQLELAVAMSESQRRFQLLDSPTGTGKSIIYLALSKLLDANRTLILTGTKGLQSQLTSDFAPIGMTDIRGHQNYRCAIETGGAGGSRRRGEPVCSWSKDSCLYRQQVDRVLGARVVVTNYAYWLSLARYSNPQTIGEFDLLIADEAHDSGSYLTDAIAVELSSDDIRDKLRLSLPYEAADAQDILTWSNWAANARMVAVATYRDMKEAKAPDRDVQEVVALGLDLKRLAEAADHETQWVAERQGAVDLKFTPVWPKDFAEALLWRGVEKVVLASATLFDTVPTMLGIDKQHQQWHEATSGFAVERRPVIYIPSPRMDYRADEGTMRQWMDKIDRIIDGRLDRKGIVHSVSYDRAREIVNRSRHKSIMLTHTSRTTREIVERFKKSSAPCVLVSPAVSEGHDFPFDECRYVIISKIPFVYGREPLTKARSASHKGWLDYLAALSVVQMAGRGMRAADDAAECFVTDGHWGDWFAARAHWPKWFQKAFRWESPGVIPPPIDHT